MIEYRTEAGRKQDRNCAPEKPEERMDHYLLQILKETTGYIEDHLLQRLDLDRISDHVNLSKFHLLRIWKGATSTGLMEYVRRRRIASSLGDLMNNRHSIEFISCQYGFGTDRSYNRAFKEEYGTTPAKWRRHPTPLNILDRFNPDFFSQAGEGLVFLRAVTVMPGFSIGGPIHRVDIRENWETQVANRLGNDFFHGHRKEIIHPVARDIYVGYTTVPVPETTWTRYQPSLLVDKGSILPEGMEETHVAPHKYGVFTYMGLHRPEEISSKNLMGLWQLVHGTWMPTVDITVDPPFHFERIDYSRCNKQYCECELYYPICRL